MGYLPNIAPWIATLLVGFLGLGLAVFINWATYRLAYYPRRIGAWYRSPLPQRQRSWLDFLPVLGWYRMRAESAVHGPRFWVRPLLVELMLPIALCGLYSWEMEGGLLPSALRSDQPAEQFVRASGSVVYPDESPELRSPVVTLHAQFFTHVILIVLMTIASLIDFDERLIPDTITIPGTLLGIALCGAFPYNQLLFEQFSGGSQYLERLHTASPEEWPTPWNEIRGLTWAVLGYSGWCFALADRRVILRRGWKKAVRYFLAGLVRHPTWKILVTLWVGGILAIVVAHRFLPPEHWRGVLSSLFGMVLGGAIVWAVRIVASLALRIEALGFGDVTLMAMIGAYLGWQPTWLAFFLAPMISIVIVLVNYVITRDPATPYGPYLCLGSVAVLVGWDRIFNQWAFSFFAMGSLFVAILLAFLFLMGVVLWIWYWIKIKFLLRDFRT